MVHRIWPWSQGRLVAAVASAVRFAVRRRRVQPLPLDISSLIPAVPDFEAPASEGAPSQSHVVDFSDILGNLLRPHHRHCKSFEVWQPSCRALLLSAISDGQWPQAARLAATKQKMGGHEFVSIVFSFAWDADAQTPLPCSATGGRLASTTDTLPGDGKQDQRTMFALASHAWTFHREGCLASVPCRRLL